MSDGELVRRVIAGDLSAYEALVRRWYYRILAFCQSRLMGQGRFESEDLAQDVLVRGYTELNSLSDPEHFGAWLRGIASHVCSDWCRHHRRVIEQMDGEVSAPRSNLPLPIDVVVADDERALVLQQISTIPEELREVILLHYYEDLTYDEMARWLGVARATVNERLAKARDLLRTRLAMLRSEV